MDLFSSGFVKMVSVSVVLIILASASCLLLFTSGSVPTDLTNQHLQRPVSGHSHKRKDALQYYYESELANFAAKHPEDLLSARKDRRMECGSIISSSAIDCSLCVWIVEILRGIVSEGHTQDEVAKVVTTICIELQIEDERVCKAVVQEFKSELFGVTLRLAYEPREVCGYILNTDCGAPYNPNAMWNVTLPDVPKPPVVPPALPKPGSPTLRVLHITDYHMDPGYTPGSDTQCGEPLCCRADDGPPKPGESGAGKYGDYRNCDTAPITVDSLFKYFQSIEDTFDYVLFTGDIPPHNVWNQSRSDQISALGVFEEYAMRYLPNKMVFSTLGNHESAPVNSFPPPYVTGNDSESWLYSAVADSWLKWLPADTEATIKRAGFYVVKPFLGLRIISLNMNMCNNGNWWLYINATDPAGMLQWFISQLQDAEDAGDKVHVIGHIPPGACLKPFSYNYYRIINRYESTIVGQFFGHVHPMTYEVFYDEETLKRPLGVVFMPGSITTYSNLNPGYRIYEIDGNYQNSSWQVLDYTNYFMNLTHANLYNEIIWQKEYNAKEAYGLTSLFPKDWNAFIYRMKADDDLFQLFCRHSKKSAPNNCSQCTGNCKRSFLCGLKSARNGDPNICNDL